MPTVLGPFRFLLIAVAGWMNQRRRLEAKAKGLGRKLLEEVATIVTPETLLAWHRAQGGDRRYRSFGE